MDVEEKLALVSKPPTEEIVVLDELKKLFETNPHPDHYIGLEISGLLHLGSLITTGFKINDFLKAGVRCKVFLADWHSFINSKFGGNWEKIRIASKYYEDAFKFFCPGVEVIHGSELYHNNDEYWKNIVKFAREITLARVTRCLTIMGRSEKETLDFAKYIYPAMQAVDIKAMDLDIVHAGMDQRKVHMLAREVFQKMGWKVPIAVHHHLLPGLGEPVKLGLDEDSRADVLISSKMSKSKPWTSIFVHDTEEQIKEKLKKAWCPEGTVENNPVLEFAKYLLFHEFKSIEIQRPAKFGGNVTFYSYQELREAYSAKKLHPVDLKNSVSMGTEKVVAPIREHFAKKAEFLEIFKNE
ncbi:MAG: tyrosine--tRNA ligase [Thaumarchaeota archaeon]|nr:tyrosine--tRNA ligase [Nitrososphaerota archaeon]